MTKSFRTLLIVDDDASLARTLKRSFERRNYLVSLATSEDELEIHLKTNAPPSHAIVDLKLGSSSGLRCVERLHAAAPATQIVVLTGYASISTAVEAIKLGASHYLAKPSNTDDIEAAFEKRAGDPDISLNNRQSSIKTVEWEHIHQALADANFNISQAARTLGMHRRTLARKLQKHHVK